VRALHAESPKQGDGGPGLSSNRELMLSACTAHVSTPTVVNELVFPRKFAVVNQWSGQAVTKCCRGDKQHRLALTVRLVFQLCVVNADAFHCPPQAEPLLRTFSKLPSESLNHAALKGPSTAIPSTNRRPGNSSKTIPRERKPATSASTSSTTQPH
jgi:hypothetical protein